MSWKGNLRDPVNDANVGKGTNIMVFETVTRAKMWQPAELAQIQLVPKGCVEVLQNKNL